MLSKSKILGLAAVVGVAGFAALASTPASAVVSIREALPGEYAPGVQSVIAIGRLRQGVRESRTAATAMIRAHGGLI